MKKIIFLIFNFYIKYYFANSFNNLVWSNEFNDYNDLSNWEIVTGSNYGWGNNELEYYTENNIYIENGSLNIVAKKEDYDSSHYTSARLFSYYSFLYGRIEARIKIPKGFGIWNAFWLFPRNSIYSNWPSSGEIDIMESVNEMNTIFGTVHYGNEFFHDSSNCQTTNFLDYSNDYHIYAVEWEENEIRWYIDDQLFCSKNNWWNNFPYPAPFNQNFNIILNIAVGGNMPGFYVDDNLFPHVMSIDYIRVYQYGEINYQLPYSSSENIPYPSPEYINTPYPSPEYINTPYPSPEYINTPYPSPEYINTPYPSSENTILNTPIDLITPRITLDGALENNKKKYIGCYKDAENRVMNIFYKMPDDIASVEICFEYCYTQNTLYFGLEYYNECYCGNSYDLYGLIDENNCNYNCKGNYNDICGGGWALSVYSMI
jgi:beta-glucanase (GH16 family)